MRISSILYLLIVSSALAVDPDIATIDKWYVDMDRPAFKNITIRRGDTVILEPTFRNYGEAKDLSGVNTVRMLYRSSGMMSSYVITGYVQNATCGVARVRWTAAHEPTNSTLSWEMVLSGSSSTVCRAYGTLTLAASLLNDGTTNATPRTFSSIDFATTELLNVGLAPFLSSYDTADLTAFMNSAQDGTADLDVDTLNVRGALTASASGLTNFPTNVVTDIINGGTAGTSGTISRANGSVTITFPIGGGEGGAGVSYMSNLLDVVLTDLQTGDSLKYNGTNWYNTGTSEALGTNRLAWVINGVTVGYVDTNGITMLHGSLQLYEDDLNCNVRAYDGARATPSICFWSRPDMGWYNKSYQGDYAFAYAQTNTDILYLHRYGLTMAGTNPVNAYAVNVSGAYRVNGTNGTSYVITNVVDGVTNLYRFTGGIGFGGN